MLWTAVYRPTWTLCCFFATARCRSTRHFMDYFDSYFEGLTVVRIPSGRLNGRWATPASDAGIRDGFSQDGHPQALLDGDNSTAPSPLSSDSSCSSSRRHHRYGGPEDSSLTRPPGAPAASPEQPLWYDAMGAAATRQAWRMTKLGAHRGAPAGSMGAVPGASSRSSTTDPPPPPLPLPLPLPPLRLFSPVVPVCTVFPLCTSSFAFTSSFPHPIHTRPLFDHQTPPRCLCSGPSTHGAAVCPSLPPCPSSTARPRVSPHRRHILPTFSTSLICHLVTCPRPPSTDARCT